MRTLVRLTAVWFRDTAWAPLLVILFRAVAMANGVRQPLDPAIHFSGGFAIAYVLYRGVRIFAPVIGSVTVLTRYLLAFTAACTVALFWEFGEFVSDLVRGTHIQHSVRETLGDLIFGTFGALLSLALIAIVEAAKKRRDSLS